MNFCEMAQDSVEDIKVAFFIIDPTFKLSPAQKDLYNLQRKYFKYKKVEEFSETYNLNSDEDVIKVYNLLKRARDPRETFNLVRRLP
jgi:hypothetical protein